jgi:hypothetical protein
MAYIGKTPVIGNFQKCDSIAVVNGQAAYTLQVGGTNVSPQSENHMLVSLNGILQAPVDSFTVSGSTLTFASNLITGDVIDFVMILGNVLDLGVPSDNTVTTAKLADSSVSLAKLTATGTKDATTFLRGDNTFAEAGGGIEMAQQWRLATSFTGSAVPIASNWEIVDTDGYGGIGSSMTESSGIFTFPSTGIYLINFYADFYIDGDDRVSSVQIDTTTNNSTYDTASEGVLFIQQTSGTGTFNSASTQFMFDVTDTSTHKCRFNINTLNANTQILGSSGYNATYVTFVRLGDT